MQSQDLAISEEFISAKVRGMRSKLLEADKLKALADSRSLHDLFQRLYPDGRFDGHLPFERELLTDHVRNLDTIRRLLSGNIRDAYQWLMMQFHLDNLKVTLRGYAVGMKLEEVESLMPPLPSYMAVPTERLFDMPDPRRFAEELPVAEFGDIIAPALKPGERPDLFPVEMALDAVYSRRLLQVANACGGWILRLAAFDISIRTLFMILRARLTYKLERDAFEQYLVPGHMYLTRENISRLCAANDFTKALAAIPHSMLPAELRNGLLTFAALEDALQLRQYRLAVRCFTECILDTSVVVAYFFIKRIEFVNLLRLTESVRHSLPRDEVEANLITLKR